MIKDNTLKKYKVTQRFGCVLLGGKPPKLDTTSLYIIVGYAASAGNRPIISRLDGNEYLGENRWIVNKDNLIPQ